jgi:hypothetical protein
MQSVDTDSVQACVRKRHASTYTDAPTESVHSNKAASTGSLLIKGIVSCIPYVRIASLCVPCPRIQRPCDATSATILLPLPVVSLFVLFQCPPVIATFASILSPLRLLSLPAQFYCSTCAAATALCCTHRQDQMAAVPC